MDILAARKKAAEQAKKKAELKEAAPAGFVVHPQQVPQAPAAQEAVPPPAREQQEAPSAYDQREPLPAAENTAREEPEETTASAAEEGGEPAAPEIETLAIRLASEEYLVPIDQVREVLKIREATPVPHAPEYAPGVISLRGDMLPVIDLARRLGIPAGTRDEKSRIVVVGLDGEDAGLIVDRVSGVVRFPPEAVGPAPENVEKGGGSEYLKGIVRKEGRLYILLDVGKAAGV